MGHTAAEPCGAGHTSVRFMVWRNRLKSGTLKHGCEGAAVSAIILATPTSLVSLGKP